jgi:hypothetical protein
LHGLGTLINQHSHPDATPLPARPLQALERLESDVRTALLPSLERRPNDLPKRLVDALECASSLNRLVAAGSAAASAACTIWMKDAAIEQKELGLATSLRGTAGCTPGLMRASATLENDFLAARLMSPAALQLLRDCLALAREPGVPDDLRRPLLLNSTIDLTYQCHTFHRRLTKLCTDHGSAAVTRFMGFAVDRMGDALCFELAELPLPAPLRAQLEKYVETLWRHLRYLLCKLDPAVSKPLQHQMLSVLLVAKMHDVHTHFMSADTLEEGIVQKLQAQLSPMSEPMQPMGERMAPMERMGECMERMRECMERMDERMERVEKMLLAQQK